MGSVLSVILMSGLAHLCEFVMNATTDPFRVGVSYVEE